MKVSDVISFTPTQKLIEDTPLSLPYALNTEANRMKWFLQVAKLPSV